MHMDESSKTDLPNKAVQLPGFLQGKQHRADCKQAKNKQARKMPLFSMEVKNG